MSTIRATNLKNASSASANAVMTSGGDFTNAAGISYMGGSKNLLINSAMQVAQRSSSSAGITATGYYTADRWNMGLNSLGTITQSVEDDAPTGTGLRKSLKILCTTADSSPAASDYLQITQALEGQDVQRIAKGTASAQPLTLSFWVKSNLTGTYIVELRDQTNGRQVSFAYNISSSATWEKKVINIPADTVGVIANTNAEGFGVQFWLGAGSTFTSGTLSSTWVASNNANRAVGQTNLAAATNNYWQITGTQLEIGPAATSFEFEPYETTLRKCMRYFQKTYAYETAIGTATSTGIRGGGTMFSSATVTGIRVSENFSVVMRSAPIVTLYDSAGASGKVNFPDTNTGKTGITLAITEKSMQVEGYPTTASTDGRMYFHYVANAEL